MGEIVTCLANVSTGYDNYMFAVCNKYRSTAERVITELFEEIAKDLGKENVIVKPVSEAIHEAEELFQIGIGEKRPVLVLTDVPPDKIREIREKGQKLKKEIQFLKIPLGSIENEDAIRHFFFEVVKLLKSEEYSKIEWRKRKILVEEKLKHSGVAGVIVSILGLFL